MMQSYSCDKQIRVDYQKVINKTRFYRNSVGCKTYTPLTIALSYSDDDSIFLDTSTGDDTWIGTTAKPKKTLLAAQNSCWSQKTKVIVLNNCNIEEDLSMLSNEYCIGVFAAVGVTAFYIQWVQSFTPSNSNSIFVAEDGNDSTGDGTEELPYLTIPKAESETDGSHQAVCMMGDAIYTVNNLAFSGNFKKLIGMPGRAPTIRILEAETACDYGSASSIKEKTQITTTSKLLKTVQLSNGNVAILRQVTVWKFWYILTDWEIYHYIDIYDKKGNVITSSIVVDDLLQWVAGTGAPNESSTEANSDLIVFDSGNFVVVWTSRNSIGQVVGLAAVVFDDDGEIIIGKTILSASLDWSSLHAVKCASDTFTVYSINGYMGCWDKVLTAQYAVKTSLTVPATAAFTIVYLPTADKIGLIYYSSGGKLIYFNAADGSSVGGSLTWESGNVPYLDAVAIMADDRVIVVYEDANDSDKGKLAIISNLTLDSTNIFEASAITRVSCAILLNGAVFITFLLTGQLNYCIWSVDTPTQRVAPTVIDSTASDVSKSYVMNNSNVFITWGEDSGYNYSETLFYTIIRPYLYEPFTAGVDAVLEGIIFDLEEKNIVKQLFTATAGLTLKHCEIKNLSPFYDEKTYLITSDSALDIEDCEIHNCAGEIYSETNSAIIKNNLIHDILDNEDIYAVHIKGSGDGIDIEYNTIANIVSGLYLESNDGDEIVKNNIIFGADIYAIDATNEIETSYSILSGTVQNVTLGDSILDVNPQFLNEGELDPTMADYRLKNTIVGDPVTSPAYLLADGIPLERDAGCYDTVIIGPGDTFTSAWMEKPIKLDVSLDPQGVTRDIMDDGTIKTSVKSWLEQVVINLKGLENADRDKLVAILTCGVPEVRLYPDPTTYPELFNTYQVVYEKMPLSPDSYQLSRTGVNASALTLERKY